MLVRKLPTFRPKPYFSTPFFKCVQKVLWSYESFFSSCVPSTVVKESEVSLDWEAYSAYSKRVILFVRTNHMRNVYETVQGALRERFGAGNSNISALMGRDLLC